MRLLNIFLLPAVVSLAQGEQTNLPYLLDGFSNKVELIFSDIDGTLSKGKIDELVVSNVDAFSLAKQLGLSIGVATGRSLSRALKFFGDENMKKMQYSGAPGVFLNGGYVLGAKGEVLRNAAFKPEVVKAVGLLAEEHGMLPDAEFCKVDQCLSHLDLDEQESSMDGVIQIRLMVSNDKRPSLVQEIKKLIKEPLQFNYPRDHALELHVAGSTKGNGVQLIAESLGVPLKHVLVLGNAENDASMFKIAGAGVAVADAEKEAFEAATAVGLPSTEGALRALVEEVAKRKLHQAPPAV